MYRLHTFGGPFLENDGVRVTGDVAQRKRVALLAILAVEQRSGITRDKVAALLWPESDEIHARNALYQAVAAIRRGIGRESIVGGSTGELRLNTDLIDSDIADFQLASAVNDYEATVRLYAGPFLDGIHIRSANEFEGWSSKIRADCATRCGQALRNLADVATTFGDYATAASWLRRLAELDPFSPHVALHLMQALAQSGERAAAIRHGRHHTEFVRWEFGLEPDRRIEAMIDDLLQHNDRGELSARRLPTSATLPVVARS